MVEDIDQELKLLKAKHVDMTLEHRLFILFGRSKYYEGAYMQSNQHDKHQAQHKITEQIIDRYLQSKGMP